MSKDVFDIDASAEFKSVDKLKVGVPLDGDLIGLPDTNIIIVSVQVHGFSSEDTYYEYTAKLTPKD